MLAFKVEINRHHVLTAGVDDWSILGLHVTASRGQPDGQTESAREDSVQFSVGGLSQRGEAGEAHHFRWPEQDLIVGTNVVVSVVETDSVSPPAKRYRSDAKVQENPFTAEEMKKMRYEDYLELKKEFERAGV